MPLGGMGRLGAALGALLVAGLIAIAGAQTVVPLALSTAVTGYTQNASGA